MTRRFSAEEAANMIVQDDSAGSDEEMDSSDDELGVGDSESEYSESECEEEVRTEEEEPFEDAPMEEDNSLEEGEPLEEAVQSVDHQPLEAEEIFEEAPPIDVQPLMEEPAVENIAPVKRIRIRGRFAGRRLRTRGGCKSVISRESNPAATGSAKEREKSRVQSLWLNEPNEVADFRFNEQPGLKIAMERKHKLDFFNLFVTDEFINMLVVETNRYANQEIDRRRPLQPNSRYKSWQPIDAVEMKKFIGILYLMGIVRLPTIELYWSRDVLYRFNGFCSVMSRNRFQEILRFWHFADNNIEVSRLDKVMPLVDQLNLKIEEIYHPRRDLSIDESMMLWRERLLFHQYIKNKRHKYGVKFYELCESNGLVLKVRIYSGESVPDDFGLGQSGAIVINLMDGLLDKGYRLFVDNYYNSFELAQQLIKEKTYICGTLRSDRTSNPLDVTKAKLSKGEVVHRSRDGVVVSKWKDKRDVLTISNMHAVEMVETTNRRGNKKQKPNIVRDYNNGMSGVDKSDQMISYYDSLRKTIRWYKKVGLHVLDIMMHDSFALHVLYGTDKKVSLLKYRETVIKSLLCLNDADHPEEQYQDDFHYLMPLPPSEKKEKPTKPCVVCSRQKKRKESRYYCETCLMKPALCIGLCFRNYHV